jgi:hypothetical protein
MTRLAANPAMSLEDLQRAMAAAVMTPLAPDESMSPRTSDGREMSDLANSFIAPNSHLTAFERLEIYNRQYWFRVLGALAEDFPALQVLLGARRFDALAAAYLAANPSRSFSLRNLGANLPEWLEQNPSFAGRRHAVAVDVARVEWAFVESFDSDENHPLTLGQIAALDANSPLTLQPHVRLLALGCAADELAIALHQREKAQTSEAGVRPASGQSPLTALPRVHRRSTWVAAHRVDLSVYFRRLAPEEYRTLAAIRAGQPLGAALESGFASSRMPLARRAPAIQQWFAAWAEFGWLCAPQS